MKTLYLLCTLFLGFVAFTAYKHFDEGVKECISPIQRAVTTDQMMRALDNECKKAQNNGNVAERILNAISR